MPHRNSTDTEQPTTALRRSPRLLSKNQTLPEDPRTPNPKTRTKRVPFSDPPSPPSSTQRVSSKKTRYRKRYANEVPNNLKKSEIGSKSFAKLSNGSKRSERLNIGVEGFSCPRRSPRFTGSGNFENVKSNQDSSSDKRKSEVGFGLQKQFGCRIEKRVTRRSNRRDNGESVGKTENDEFNRTFGCVSTKFPGSEASQMVERAESEVHSCEQTKGNMEKRTGRGSVDMKGREIDKGKKVIGVKRKRNRVEKGNGIVQGWTEDQELALQRAYLAAKPTPHFWKKVAKLVPGKSEQDCFNKVHSDHLTPPQPRLRSRAKRTNSPSFSISPTKLLNSVEPKTKQPISSKQRRRLAHKTVRQLREKHYLVSKDHEADLFSVLESTFNKGIKVLSTPECGKEKVGFLTKCRERSSSARKKSLSRFGGSCGATLVSPPVLKQVKNKALHEKYIDQLHCREAKRKAAFGRARKSVLAKEGKNESQIREMDAIKAAKNALVFEARDVINQFQHLNTNAMSNLSNDDDFDDDDDDDEGEDEL